LQPEVLKGTGFSSNVAVKADIFVAVGGGAAGVVGIVEVVGDVELVPHPDDDSTVAVAATTHAAVLRCTSDAP
jgi:hypothetical protein